ncbi:hypothetical protein [Halorientalis sp. IM1011]|uniref:hypothetical protein n=1 Tax=Halorientalis sp. IM1011 TaxID=1932360 RepID=UPI0012FB2366|nr:hypothetical protein [Halorientalis sp. IM1011]
MQEPSGRAHLSRRSFVRLGAVGILTSAAGCLGPDETNTESDQGAREENLAGQSSLVEAIEFEGQDLVVQLVDNHDISKLNLLDPEGSLYTSASVATGETTVRLQIIEIQSVTHDYSHYTPGEHELALISDGSINDTVAIDLEPSLEITDVQQYRDGEYDDDYGKLVITVHNSGTGPTWVYDIAYSASPNFAADGDLAESYRYPVFTAPDESRDLSIPPGESQQYIPVNYPLHFPSTVQQGCNLQSSQMDVLVGGANDQTLRARIGLHPDGDVAAVIQHDWYACTAVEAEFVEEQNDG